jgi:hypothetical protein
MGGIVTAIGCYPNRRLKNLRILVMIHVPREFPMVHPARIGPVGPDVTMCLVARVFTIIPENTTGCCQQARDANEHQKLVDIQKLVWPGGVVRLSFWRDFFGR